MAFIRRATWLTDSEAPLIYAGLVMAQTLDSQAIPATNLLTEYNRHCRYLIAMSPQGAVDDELGKFLKANVS